MLRIRFRNVLLDRHATPIVLRVGLKFQLIVRQRDLIFVLMTSLQMLHIDIHYKESAMLNNKA